MKNFTAVIFILTGFLINGILHSQNVATYIPGPSTFDDGLTMDVSGNIYASRYIGSTVTKITPDGQTSIFASGIPTPNGSDIGPDGYLYVPSNVNNGKIYRVSPSGAVEIFINSIPLPSVVLFRSDGKMYISSYQTDVIYLADSTGAYSTLYSGNGMNDPVGLTMDDNENLIIANFTDGKIFSVNSAGVFTQLADIPGIVGFIEYSNGYVYSTGFSTNKIYKTSLSGVTSILAGTGATGQTNGSSLSATFDAPNGIVASLGGDSLFISDFNARSLRLISGISTGITNISSVLPNGFELHQNYPNPFNPVTKIRFEISSGNLSDNSSPVRMTVYDATGKEISELVNQKLSPGKYEVEFDGGNLSSGVYFYKLESGDFSLTKRMTLLK
ncbi:MAG: T9SS type A sorting domain-containing protein [Bacteroidetes bacterium]|nr:T9SS type A sorting domain-containing protein [Bacteroidota bacterium]